MASTEIRAPFAFFTDTEGNPLENGYIYIGEENLNPLANPKAAYWDYALTIPAYNVRTSAGLPMYSGSPGRLYVDGAHSMIVKNKNGEIVYSAQSIQGESEYTSFISDVTRISIDRSHYWGEPFPLLEYRVPSPWYASTPDTYFPAICLTDVSTYTDLAEANWGAATIARLREIKIVFKEGMVGAISSPSVTNWAIVSNVATLTFVNNADTMACLTSLLEDEQHHGSYSNWRTVTLASAIGDISAGTYAITNVNAGARTLAFSFTAADNSGAGSFTVDFYAYRIAGSTTSARLFSARGLSIIGVNDANGYFVSGGLRRRGYFQGHLEQIVVYGNVANNNGSGGLIPGYNAGDTPGQARSTSVTGAKISNGVDGTPRTAKETHSPAIAVHYYLHFGSYAV